MAKFDKDKPLKNPQVLPEWLIPIQVGAALTQEKVADVSDDIGDNISSKNANYCDLEKLSAGKG